MTPEQPVIIVGAGPCGLLAALVLQRRGVPCIVLERQFQTQHKADVGSGYEIAPTAQKLLERVGLPADDGFWTPFGGMLLQDMHGKTLRRIDGNYTLKVVSRSTLQTRLLQALGWTLDLRFGVEVVDFVQDDGSVCACARLWSLLSCIAPACAEFTQRTPKCNLHKMRK